MSYIYEMDVTHLRISYILPPNWICRHIITELRNNEPEDRTNMEIIYTCYIRHVDCNKENCNEYSEVLHGESFGALIEKVRKWAIRYTQPPVSKSPKDGTDSVITG